MPGWYIYVPWTLMIWKCHNFGFTGSIGMFRHALKSSRSEMFISEEFWGFQEFEKIVSCQRTEKQREKYQNARNRHTISFAHGVVWLAWMILESHRSLLPFVSFHLTRNIPSVSQITSCITLLGFELYNIFTSSNNHTMILRYLIGS